MPAYKVTHIEGDKQTVYLVPSAKSTSEAKEIVRWECLDKPRQACELSAVEAESPIRLYSFNIATGEMS